MNNPHNTRYQTERRVFGYALTQSPETLYVAVNHLTTLKDPYSLGTATAQHIKNNLVHTNNDQPLDSSYDDALILLAAGVKDISTALYGEFATIANLSPQHANELATAPATLHTIAHLAQPEANELETPLTADSQLEMTSQLHVSDRYGCPFAGHEGIVEPDPIFTRFSIWAGRLAVINYFDR